MKSMKKSVKIALGILVVLMVIGLGCWIGQQIFGLGITGMSNGTSWGLYICLFLLFVGLSAGGLIVASAGSVFHIEDYEKIALPAIATSLSCILVAGALVLVDLGGIVRIWRMIVGPNFMSPLVWDMCVITLYIIMSIVELVFLVSKKEGAAHKQWVASCIALPVAILVHSVTAWILGLQIGRDWYSSIMAPLFVVSAMDSGLGLLILALFGLRKGGWFQVPDRLFSKLAILLATVVALDFYFVFCEVLASAYPQEEHVLQTLREMFAGATAPFFWLEIILLVVSFVMLASKKRRQNMKLVGWASALVVVSVFCKRVWLLFSSFIHPNIAYGPGISSGSLSARLASGDQIWAVTSNYAPTVPEIMIALAVISFGVAVFIVLIHKLLPKYKEVHAAQVAELEQETAAERAAK